MAHQVHLTNFPSFDHHRDREATLIKVQEKGIF